MKSTQFDQRAMMISPRALGSFHVIKPQLGHHYKGVLHDGFSIKMADNLYSITNILITIIYK